MNQAISQAQNPCKKPVAAKATVQPAAIQIIGVRRRRKLSAHRAIAGPVTAWPNSGAARITASWAPLNPWA